MSTSDSKIWDVAILGGGHNGLVTAFYLAEAGLDVIVLEKNAVVGGAAVTEEFHPGFRNSVASYTVSLLQSEGDRRSRSSRATACASSSGRSPISGPVDATRGLVMPYGLANRQAAIAAFSKARCRATCRPMTRRWNARPRHPARSDFAHATERRRRRA